MLEIGPERRRLSRPRELDAEGEMGPEAVILAAWGGESGRGPARVEGGRRGTGGGGAAEFQKSSFSKKRTLGNLHWGSVVDPTETLMPLLNFLRSRHVFLLQHPVQRRRVSAVRCNRWLAGFWSSQLFRA